MTTEQTFYTCDPESPFYPFMQDKSVEKGLDYVEKQELYQNAENALASGALDGLEVTQHLSDFVIYANLNKLPKDEIKEKVIDYVLKSS